MLNEADVPPSYDNGGVWHRSEPAELFSCIQVLPDGTGRKEAAAPRRLHLYSHMQSTPDNSPFCPSELVHMRIFNTELPLKGSLEAFLVVAHTSSPE